MAKLEELFQLATRVTNCTVIRKTRSHERLLLDILEHHRLVTSPPCLRKCLGRSSIRRLGSYALTSAPNLSWITFPSRPGTAAGFSGTDGIPCLPRVPFHRQRPPCYNLLFHSVSSVFVFSRQCYFHPASRDMLSESSYHRTVQPYSPWYTVIATQLHNDIHFY